MYMVYKAYSNCVPAPSTNGVRVQYKYCTVQPRGRSEPREQGTESMYRYYYGTEVRVVSKGVNY